MADDASRFTAFVPGFEFMQNLVKSAGAAIPGMGQWVAPTLDPAELDKRIEELRTVQFWLEQNARMLGATVQALEVQRMTLSTLQTMNVQMGDLRDSLRIRVPEPATPPRAAPAEAAGDDEPEAPASARRAGARRGAAAERTDESATGSVGAPPAVDPMQWWGALTQQFTELAASAMKDTAGGAARKLADTVVKQSIDATGQALKSAAAMPAAVARKATGAPPPAPKRRPAARKPAR